MLMKKIYTILWALTISVAMMAQGWPEKYEGVMLQGFYWDSYADSKWTNLESQADELSQYFDLIWVPQSGYCNTLSMQMGYSDIWWLNHNSCFGTEEELRSMINTYKAKGVGIIEDVVINHKNGNTSWCDFPDESKNGYTLTWDNVNFSGICQTDECNNSTNLPQWSPSGKKTTGASDTGTDFNGCRDLDHTNAQVRQNIKTYLKFLRNDLGYTGFRYDMVGGYAPKYVGEYNTTENVNPEFSVGEYWMNDGNPGLIKWLNGTKVDGKIQSAVFDFTTKWNINDVFANATNWSKLNNAALANDADYARYAVTFVDNHDTGRSGNNPLYANVEAANAYILTMPGTPCVWLKHWQVHKVTIKKMILVRKIAGIHNQSSIVTKTASTNGYVLNVEGKNGNVLLLLGSATASTDGYKLALEGTNFKMYVSNSLDISALDNVKEDEFKAPDYCVVNDGETCAFYEAPTSYTNVKCWAWDASNNYTGGKWPGASCTKVGTNNGKNVWKWTYSGSLTTKPTFIIFSDDGNNQTSNLDFQNGGYYNEAGAIQGIVTGIESIRTTPSYKDNVIYDLQGRRVMEGQMKKGIYIVNGKKVIR